MNEQIMNYAVYKWWGDRVLLYFFEEKLILEYSKEYGERWSRLTDDACFQKPLRRGINPGNGYICLMVSLYQEDAMKVYKKECLKITL